MNLALHPVTDMVFHSYTQLEPQDYKASRKRQRHLPCMLRIPHRICLADTSIVCGEI